MKRFLLATAALALGACAGPGDAEHQGAAGRGVTLGGGGPATATGEELPGGAGGAPGATAGGAAVTDSGGVRTPGPPAPHGTGGGTDAESLGGPDGGGS
jgi:hypothetical protein